MSIKEIEATHHTQTNTSLSNHIIIQLKFDLVQDYKKNTTNLVQMGKGDRIERKYVANNIKSKKIYRYISIIINYYLPLA